MTVSITTICIKCHYAENRNLFFVMLNVDMLSVMLGVVMLGAGNTKRGSITVPLTSFWLVWNQLHDNWQFLFLLLTDYSKPVKHEVNGNVILPPLVFPAGCGYSECRGARLLGQFLPFCNNLVRWQISWRPPQLLGGFQWRNDDQSIFDKLTLGHCDQSYKTFYGAI